MAQMVVEKQAINSDLLHAELKAQLGAVFKGVGFINGEVFPRLREEATLAQRQLAKEIIEAHDPRGETDLQRRQRERDQAQEIVIDIEAWEKLSDAEKIEVLRKSAMR